MVVTAIISVFAPTPARPIIETLATALKALDPTLPFVIGTKIQDPTTIQITSSWPSIEDSKALHTSAIFQRLLELIHKTTSSPLTTTIADLKTASASSTIISLPLTEWVKIDFQATDTTPAFQAQIEADFARFEALFRRRGPADGLGEGALSTGWAEEQNGVGSFVVRREWHDMDAFGEAIGTESFKEGVGILTGWGAPFNLWHVETNVSQGMEGLRGLKNSSAQAVVH